MDLNEQPMLNIDPPNELRFTGPFTRPVVTIMKLSNPSEHTMLFKIKTTAPKRYCVRPNFGSVLPNSFTKVEICLQPFVYDASEKNKHKFMVQSLVAPDDCLDLNKLWKEVQPEQLMDAKLKCVFEMPTMSNADTSGSASVEKSKEGLSPKASEEKISNLQTSDQSESLITELRQLRDENSELRKDNINLKEQLLAGLHLSSANKPSREAYSPPAVAEKQIPTFFIALAVAALIFGLVLGKVLF